MACAVREFMKERAVILGNAGELHKLRHGHAVAGRRVERSVAVLDGEPDSGALDVVLDDLVGSVIGGKMLSRRRFFCKVRLNALALVDMEHVVVAQERYALHDRFAICAINDVAVIISFRTLHELPEYDHAGLLSFSDMTAFALGFLERDKFAAAAAEKYLIEQAVLLARCVTDRALNAAPWLLPRNDALFKLCDDAIRNDLK